MGLDGKATDKRRIQDNNGNVMKFSSEGAIYSKTCENLKVIEGDLFYAEIYESSLADGNSITMGIIIPDGNIFHGILCIESDDSLVAEVYENVTFTGGSSVTVYNVNRTSSNSSGATIVKNPTVSSYGTKIETIIGGSAGGKFSSGQSPSYSSGANWMFKPNAKYLIKVTNDSGDASKVKVSYLFHLDAVS